jgi:hypothetical protein
MKRTHSHDVTSSFIEWIDHTLLYDGEAYQNISGQFYEYTDQELPDSYGSYNSSYKQFVYNSAITGANIFTGIYGDIDQGSENASGVYLDYVDGRIIGPDSILTGSATLSGSFAVKDFNTYLVSERDEKMLFEDVYKVSQSRYQHKSGEAAIPYEYYAPACFIVPKSSANIPFAFGGEVDSNFRYRAIIVAENQYDLEGCFSVLRDKSETNVCLLPPDRLPLNQFGDIKSQFSGSYNYLNEIDNSIGMVYVNSVSTAIVGSVSSDKSRPNMYMGFADFDLSSVRFKN